MGAHHVAVSSHDMLPSSSTTTKTISVFWPHGLTKSGVCYGWLKPAICVAGVVDVCTFTSSYISHKLNIHHRTRRIRTRWLLLFPSLPFGSQ